ncbi:MAG: hypothetical protein WC008_03760 [Bacilli bacterium]
MLEQLLHRQVEILVALSAAYASGGSIPKSYKGTLIEVDDEFCKIIPLKSKVVNSQVIIAKKFIITVSVI